MSRPATGNLVIFMAFLLVPFVIELLTAYVENMSPTGLDVLLYWPFEFGYIFLATIVFILFNSLQAQKLGRSSLLGGGVGLVVAGGWFAVTFLAVTQLHVSLGGVL